MKTQEIQESALMIMTFILGLQIGILIVASINHIASQEEYSINLFSKNFHIKFFSSEDIFARRNGITLSVGSNSRNDAIKNGNAVVGSPKTNKKVTSRQNDIEIEMKFWT